MARSALLNIMVTAAFKAGRSLTRDFGEVENLQVSVKGPADFVSNADRAAEKIVHDELSKARPTYGFLMEEGGEIKGTDGSIAGSSIHSTAPPISCTASRCLPWRSRCSAARRSSPR
jgi:3'-phosphoadenosine 5'-phosphosulfate (PAPS) 3'-phosphatase